MDSPKNLDQLRDKLLPGLYGTHPEGCLDYIVTDSGLVLAEVKAIKLMVSKEEFESGNWKEPYLARFRELGK
jgi:hypothetical protein